MKFPEVLMLKQATGNIPFYLFAVKSSKSKTIKLSRYRIRASASFSWLYCLLNKQTLLGLFSVCEDLSE